MFSAHTSPTPRSEEVMDWISQQIASGAWSVGSRIPPEIQLMAHFGVSRTVVRDALNKLKARGMLRSSQGLGTFVASAASAASFSIGPAEVSSLTDLLSVLELRMGLEPEAAALAAARRSDEDLQALQRAYDHIGQAWSSQVDPIMADFQFHLEVARASGNPHYVSMLTVLSPASLPRCWEVSYQSIPQGGAEYFEHVDHEHEDVYRAIVRRNPEMARAAMREHLSRSCERYRALAAQGPRGGRSLPRTGG
ncbi:MAG: FadR family transcriptional regulator [Curvibacter sp.]|nr:FadR family transcriptional regulator [Curvibacter sp.]